MKGCIITGINYIVFKTYFGCGLCFVLKVIYSFFISILTFSSEKNFLCFFIVSFNDGFVVCSSVVERYRVKKLFLRRWLAFKYRIAGKVL